MATTAIHQRSALVSFEGPHGYSTESVDIGETQAIEFGQVLGQVTSTGECVPFNPDAADGSEIAFAVATEEKTSDDETATIGSIARFAQLIEDSLVWDDSVTDEQKAVALEKLKWDNGIVTL